MSLAISSDFLFGVIVGGLLVVAGQPLLRSLSKTSGFLPFLLIVAALLFLLFLWLRS